MNIWETIILFFSFQAALLGCLFLLKNNGDFVANKLFGLFLIMFAYSLFFNVLYWSGFDKKLLVDLNLTDEIPLSLFGPLFFLYVQRVVTGRELSYKSAWHLIPLAVALIKYGPFYFLTRKEKLDLIVSGSIWEYLRFTPHYGVILAILLLAYSIYIFLMFVRHYRSDPEMKLWLRITTGFFVLFSLSYLSYYFLVNTSLLKTSYDYLISMAMVFFVGISSYFAFMQPAIFNGKSLQRMIPFIKYEKTGLSREFSMELKRKLLSVMEMEKPYLVHELRLNTLAEMLDISRHHASQIINEHFSMNFYDFINRYRIKEAELLLSSDNSHPLSITDIAYQSGFNNRISFYKAFKKIKGISPSEYREQVLLS